MKKKIILMLTMCALLVCLFVISVSALNPVIYSQHDNFRDLGSHLSGLNFYSMKSVNGYEDTFSIYSDSSSQFLIIDIDEFKSYCNKYNLKSYDDLANKVRTFDTTTYEAYEYVNFITDTLNSPGRDIFNYFYNYSTGASEEDLTAQYNQGFIDGKQDGYAAGYSEGMSDFATEEKNLIEGYYTQGGDFTAEGLNSYINDNASNNFKDVYMSAGVNSNYTLFEENFSANSSHGSSTTILNPGNNYGASHPGYIDTDCCYNPGYVDGVADGGDIYKGSESYQADIENEINTYMQSEEYNSLMNEYSTEVINNYLKSTEYKASIDSSFIAGELAGEANAYDKAQAEVYGQGVRDGQLNYRNSQEFLDAIDSSYGEGYYKGSEDGKNSVVDPTGVIALIVIVALLGVVFFIIAKKSSKKKR